MRNRVPDPYLTTPHRIEWGASAESESFDELDFASREEAVEEADRIVRLGSAVWLREVGYYPTKQGTPVPDWVIYCWNEEEWNPLGERGRGIGRPYGAPTRQVTYAPYDKHGWTLP